MSSLMQRMLLMSALFLHFVDSLATDLDETQLFFKDPSVLLQDVQVDRLEAATSS